MVDAAAISVATSIFVGPRPLGITYAATAVVVMWVSGAYRPRIYYRVSTQLPALVAQMTVSALAVAAWPDPNRLIVLERLPATVAIVVLARLATYAALRALHTRPGSRRSQAALIIGADQRGDMVADALLRNRGCGITPIGFVDHRATRADSPVPVVADLAHLEQAIERLGVRHVIVADRADYEATISTRLWHCQARDIDLWVIPPLFERGASAWGRPADDLWAIPFQHVRRPGQHTSARFVKRAFDFGVAATTIILTAPVLAVVALAVRLTSPGPVLFRQKRIGQNSRQFELLKFRTMMVNDDSDTKWSVHNDHRMTPIGRFLRLSCIDELPQFFNVLRGEMSLVGPRPERPFFDACFSETVANYPDRLRSPVGMTGWAQIHGLRGDTSIAERIRFDNFYIEHWSLWLDLVIMVRTVSALMHWMLVTDAVPYGESDAGAVPAGRATVPIPAHAARNQS